MITRIAKLGASFKGAGQYYLHDKDADTKERVEFTLTENLATGDPEMALKMMAYTAMRQDELKSLSGQAVTGRKLTKSVYSYSLSWSPEQDPSREQMIAAAKETIEILGLKDHEILMVGHNDTDHPHIHVLVNRVHPETGLAARHSNDRLKLSKWAEDYERRMGQILCEQRVENNARRAKGEFVKYQSAKDIGAFRLWRKNRLAQAQQRRQSEKDMLAATHKGERDALYDHKETQIKAAREDIRDLNKPKWAQLFEAQKAEKEKLQAQMKSARSRLFTSPEDRSVRLLALDTKHVKQRERLQKIQATQTKKAIAEINTFYKLDLEKLKITQREQTQALAAQHSVQSQDFAKQIAANTDIEIFRDEKKQAGRAGAAGGQIVASIPRPDLRLQPRPQTRPPRPEPAVKPPIGPAHETRQKRALYERYQQDLTEKLQTLKDQNRPKWAALFKAQREELRAFDKAQKAVLPRLVHHVRTRDPKQPGQLPNVIKALFGRSGDLKALRASHETARLKLARQTGRQRRQIERQAEAAYHRDLARLEKELAREAAAYKKAVEEGMTQARMPDDKATPGVKSVSDEFARQMRARIDADKKREEEERKRRGRDQGGRGRGE